MKSVLGCGIHSWELLISICLSTYANDMCDYDSVRTGMGHYAAFPIEVTRYTLAPSIYSIYHSLPNYRGSLMIPDYVNTESLMVSVILGIRW